MAGDNTERVNTGDSRDENGKWKPGVSGNPKGKPKGAVSITAEIKKKLSKVPPGQKKTYLQLLTNRIFKQAIQDGDQQMIKNIWNYVDGMPEQNVNSTLKGDLKVIIDKHGFELPEETTDSVE